MPYTVKKVEDGYKVCKTEEPQKCFSNKGLSKEVAEKQKIAIGMSGGLKPLTARVGGKVLLKKKIVDDYFPSPSSYSTYVEPFVGGGSIYFYKNKDSHKEVINDIDPDIMTIFKGFKKYPANKIAQDVNGNYTENDFNQILESNPKGEYNKFLKTFLLYRLSYFGRGLSFGKSRINSKFTGYQTRLEGTDIYNTDYKDVIKKYNKPNTFFYLDPPARESSGNYRFSSIDIPDLVKTLKTIKGKFLLSIADIDVDIDEFKKYNVVKVPTKYVGTKTRGGQTQKVKEYLIMNYKPRLEGGGDPNVLIQLLRSPPEVKMTDEFKAELDRVLADFTDEELDAIQRNMEAQRPAELEVWKTFVRRARPAGAPSPRMQDINWEEWKTRQTRQGRGVNASRPATVAPAPPPPPPPPPLPPPNQNPPQGIRYIPDWLRRLLNLPPGQYTRDDINLPDWLRGLLMGPTPPQQLAAVVPDDIQPAENPTTEQQNSRASTEASNPEGSGTHRENILKRYKLKDNGYSLEELSKVSAVPLNTLQEVYNRGIGAYKTNPKSVRLKGSYVKNVNAPLKKKLSKEQWAMARVYSFLDGNAKHDNDLRGGLKITKDSVTIPKKEFVREHKKLVKFFEEEAKDQRGELEKVTGGNDMTVKVLLQKAVINEAERQRLLRLINDTKINEEGKEVKLEGDEKLNEDQKNKKLINEAHTLYSLVNKLSNQEGLSTVKHFLNQIRTTGVGAFNLPRRESEFRSLLTGNDPSKTAMPTGKSGRGVCGGCDGACGGAISDFQNKLVKMKLKPSQYLKQAKIMAEKTGYDPSKVMFCNTGKNKLMYESPDGLVHFGHPDYPDYIIYSWLEHKGEVEEGTADKRRELYRGRATNIKGDWKKNKYSANNLAINILW